MAYCCESRPAQCTQGVSRKWSAKGCKLVWCQIWKEETDVKEAVFKGYCHTRDIVSITSLLVRTCSRKPPECPSLVCCSAASCQGSQGSLGRDPNEMYPGVKRFSDMTNSAPGHVVPCCLPPGSPPSASSLPLPLHFAGASPW